MGPDPTSLSTLVDQYLSNSGKVLDMTLRYESRPTETRRCKFDPENVEGLVLVAHYVGNEKEFKVTLSSGFALDIQGKNGEKLDDEDAVVVTCAHTLEEVRKLCYLVSDIVGVLMLTRF